MTNDPRTETRIAVGERVLTLSAESPGLSPVAFADERCSRTESDDLRDHRGDLETDNSAALRAAPEP